MKNDSSDKHALIRDADLDLLAAVTLLKYNLIDQFAYLSSQAVEKYLKVLLIDTNPTYENSDLPVNSAGNPYIPYWGHYLEKYLKGLPNDVKYDFYKKEKLESLREFFKLNESARYSILGTDKEGEKQLEKKLGKKLTPEEIKKIDEEKKVPLNIPKIKKDLWELVLRLRNDIELDRDDYPLAIALRNHHFDSPDKQTDIKVWEESAKILKETFPEWRKLIRWKASG